jgi:6-phosphogluconolactonase/Glucosamine-6-phosphate isomerase/deaminase
MTATSRATTPCRTSSRWTTSCSRSAAEEGQAGGTPGGVPLPIENLHPFRTSEAIGGSRGPEWCAATLADELRGARLALEGGWPVFDLILLGIGPDGHLLSVFPGSPAFDSEELALAIPAPTHIEPQVERVTLNPAVIGVARRVLVVVGGAGKAAVLAQILGEEHDPRRWPGQLARRHGAAWIVDAAAAASLRR